MEHEKRKRSGKPNRQLQVDLEEGLYLNEVLKSPVKLKDAFAPDSRGDERHEELESDISDFSFDPDHPQDVVFPDYLGSIARREFNSIVEQYRTAGLLNVLDTALLLIYSKCVEQHHQYEKAFHTGDYTHTQWKPSGSARSVESIMHQENLRNIITLGSQLGVSPASRKRIEMKSAKKEKTALEQFMDRKNR